MLLYHTSSKRVFGVKKIRITIHECKRIASALTDFFYDHPDFCRARKREVSWVTLAPPSVWKVPGNDTTGRLDLFSSAGSHAWDNRDYHLISLEESICVCSSVSLQCWKPAIMCKRHSILTKSSSANCSTSRVENIPSLSLSNIWKICNQTEIGLIETFPGLQPIYVPDPHYWRNSEVCTIYQCLFRVSMRTRVTFIPNRLPNHTPSVCLGGYRESLVAQWPVSLTRGVPAQVPPQSEPGIRPELRKHYYEVFYTLHKSTKITRRSQEIRTDWLLSNLVMAYTWILDCCGRVSYSATKLKKR